MGSHAGLLRVNRCPRVNEYGCCPAFTPYDWDSQGRSRYHFSVVPGPRPSCVLRPEPPSSSPASSSSGVWRPVVAVGWMSGCPSALLRRISKAGKPTPRGVLEEVGVLPDELRESSGLAISRTQPGCSGRTTTPETVPTSTPSTCQESCSRSSKWPTRWRATGRTSRRVPVLPDGEDRVPHRGTRMPLRGRHRGQRSGSSGADHLHRRRTAGRAEEARSRPPSRRGRSTIAIRTSPPMPRRSPSCQTATSRSSPRGAAARSTFSAFRRRAVAKAHHVRRDHHGAIRRRHRDSRRAENRATGHGAAVSPDGKTLAVRTYYEVFFFGLVSEGGQSRWRDLQRPCALGDAEPQGEAIDYLDANTLILTSERSRGRPGTIHRLQCR